jgi:four helix bundle protein
MTNLQCRTKLLTMPNSTQPPYDLEERTAIFGEGIIQFFRKIRIDVVTERLIKQLIGAATSVGANYCEADDAVSPKEFKQKIGCCKKEAREAKFFLRMLVKAVPALREGAVPLWQEAKELHLIFAAIYRSK